MSYYQDPQTTPPLLTSSQPATTTTGSPSAIYSPIGTGFVQGQVNPNDLVSNQLTDLLGSNSDYITQARQQASQQAASRGLLNSSIASGAGQSAAIQAGLPIATADASEYANTDAANTAAENTFLLNQGQWNTQRGIASMNLASSTAMARDEEAERAREYDLTRQDSNAHYDTDWQHQIEGSLLGTALGNISGTDSTLQQAILNDPTMLNDPAGASGLMNFWSGQFGNNLNDQITQIGQQYGINTTNWGMPSSTTPTTPGMPNVPIQPSGGGGNAANLWGG